MQGQRQPTRGTAGRHPGRDRADGSELSASGSSELERIAGKLAGLRKDASGEKLEGVLDELTLAVERLRDVEAELHRRDRSLSKQADRERRYRDLFAEAPDGYVVTDANAVILEANSAFARLVGVAPQYIVGKPLAAFVESSDRREFRARVLALGHGAGIEEWELVLRSRAGSGVPVAARASVELPAGAEGIVRWLVRDVSERKRAEQADVGLTRQLEQRVAERTAELEAAYERRNRLLERLQEGVVALNARMEVEFANAAARRILGHLREGEPLPEPWPEVSLRRLARKLLKPGPPVAETRLAVDANPKRTYALSGIRARRSEGPLLVFADVTEQERLERAEREFVTNAAHQLQSPIAAITSAVEVLQLGAKNDPEELELFLGHVAWETTRLQLLVRSLLVLARIQTGQEELVGERVEVGPLLTELVAGVTPSEEVEVRLDDPGELAVIASRGLLEQALANVIGNAVRYTGQGGVLVSAAAVNEHFVVIQVSDTGPGIAREHQEHVFERFFRGGGQSREGFGLGLPIARQAVQALGGELELESNVGTGTTVRIRLRRAT